MKKCFLLVFLCLFLLPHAVQSNDGGVSISNAWFPYDLCFMLDIKQFDYTAENAEPVKVVRVEDRGIVKNLIKEIEKIPSDGDVFKSFFAREKIELVFDCGQTQRSIEIYDAHFKTPSTGFNSSPEAQKKEEKTYKDVLSLLASGRKS